MHTRLFVFYIFLEQKGPCGKIHTRLKDFFHFSFLPERNGVLLEHNGVLLEQNGVFPEQNGVFLEQNAWWDRQKYEETHWIFHNLAFI